MIDNYPNYEDMYKLVVPVDISPMPEMANVWLADDTNQENGSFKLRGAAYAIQRALLTNPEEVLAGIFCASAGNHAQGVALAASSLGLKSHIFLPENAPECKIEAIEGFGGLITKVKGAVDDALVQAKQASIDNQGYFIHPFDDIWVIEGQSSIGYEIVEHDQDFDRVFVPVGGGGLLAGVCKALDNSGSNTLVTGVQLEGCDSFSKSIENRRLTELVTVNSLADGTAVKRAGKIALDIALDSPNFAGMITVSNSELGSALLEMDNLTDVYAETAAGLSYAGLKKHLSANDSSGVENCLAVITGKHRDNDRLEQLVAS